MARIAGNVLGNLKGKLGNLSARIVEGDTILSARPSSFNVSQTQGSIEARQKFAVTANFAKNILEIPILETIWQAVKLSGMSVFNTVFKKNRDYVDLLQPTDANIITPSGFALPVTSVTLDANSLALELGALNTAAVITSEDKDLAIAAVVAYFSPINPDDEEFKIIKLSKDVNNFDYTTSYSESINLDVMQKAVASKYNNRIIYLAVASKNAVGKVVQYSATYSDQQ